MSNEYDSIVCVHTQNKGDQPIYERVRYLLNKKKMKKCYYVLSHQSSFFSRTIISNKFRMHESVRAFVLHC